MKQSQIINPQRSSTYNSRINPQQSITPQSTLSGAKISYMFPSTSNQIYNPPLNQPYGQNNFLKPLQP